MLGKNFFLWLLSLVIFIVLFSNFGSASGCCVSLAVKTCYAVDSYANCSSTNFQYFDNRLCSEVCAKGCCCDVGQNTGVGNLNYSCSSPKTFVPDPTVNISEFCTCGALNTYTIIGTIQGAAANNPIPGAKVTAGGIENDSRLSDGTYSLSGVPEGDAVVISAFIDGCSPNTTSIKVDGDKANINVKLNCQCTPQTCNTTLKAYCQMNNTLAFYNWGTQQNAYCALCQAYDTDCQGTTTCVDGDGSCPPSCNEDNDDDCICDLDVSNGVCPITCNPTNDKDCASAVAVCGDTKITYPYETCEDNPASGQFSFCSAANCANLGEVGACNCVGMSGCGNRVLEAGEACEIGMICPNGSMCENCQCGAFQCTGNNMNLVLTQKFNATLRQVFLSWNPISSSCNPSIDSYLLYRCSKQTASDCTTKSSGFGLIFPSQQPFEKRNNYTDSSILYASEYCYYVRAVYALAPPNNVGESNISCIKTGNINCMDSHTAEFCINNARTSCDTNNNLWVRENCSLSKKYCIGPDSNDKTECTNLSVCDSCNGLYGMFSNLDLYVTEPKGQNYADIYCHIGSGPETYEGVCFLDRTKTLFSAFDYCGNIGITCYDYKSKDTCLSDPCNKNWNCAWAALDPTYPELGGVCHPADVVEQRCDLCDNEKYNWLSPNCNPRVCPLFGKCYFLGPESRRVVGQTCSKQSMITCNDYNNSVSCTNGTAVIVDATYTGTARTGGTHNIVKSKDKLELGKCYWVAGGTSGRCYRNADNLPDSAGLAGIDCLYNDTYCLADFSDPITTTIPSTYCSGTYPGDVKIKYTVSDNYPTNYLSTYFCLSQNVCYPTEKGTNGEYARQITTSGEYYLYYYSADPAKNLEKIKKDTIIIDADIPEIALLYPSNASQLPVAMGQPILSVYGKVPVDTRFVCANNKKTVKTSCINSCARNNNVQPCISSETGLFNLSIPLNNQFNSSDITFYSQDCAGNTYSNTLLGIVTFTPPPMLINISVYPYT